MKKWSIGSGFGVANSFMLEKSRTFYVERQIKSRGGPGRMSHWIGFRDEAVKWTKQFVIQKVSRKENEMVCRKIRPLIAGVVSF